MIRAALFLALASAASAAPGPAFFKALHQVETSGRHGAILGDNGQALGPLQIHRAYWNDAGLAGRYEDCARLDYSIRVVDAYLRRFAPRAYAAGDCRILARVHNGGPAGARKSATISYANKVQRLIRK